MRLAYAKLGHAASHEEQLAYGAAHGAQVFAPTCEDGDGDDVPLLRDPGSVNRIPLQAYVEGGDLPPPVADEGRGIDDAAMAEHKLEKWIENVPNYDGARPAAPATQPRAQSGAQGLEDHRKHARFIEKVRLHAALAGDGDRRQVRASRLPRRRPGRVQRRV